MIRNYLLPILSLLLSIGIFTAPLFGQVEYVGILDTPGCPFDVFSLNDLVYVADFDYGLQIVDVSFPAGPVLVGGWDTPGDAIGVFVLGNYAYIADYDSGFQIINV